MKKLLIDAGNSSIKWSILDNNQLTNMQSCPYKNQLPIEVFKNLIRKQLKKSSVKSVVLVSVLGEIFIKNAENHSQKTSLKFISVNSQAQLAGVTNAYNEAYKLGADRFTAMIAAHHLGRNSNDDEHKFTSIIVDSGTATTIDAIDYKGQHLGGVILSGLDLCSESLLKNTELLPILNKSEYAFEPNIFSTDTTQAIVSGSIFGLSGAISNICSHMEQRINNREVSKTVIKKIICGGSSEKLLPYLDEKFLLQKDLLMHGLKVIAEMSENK